MSMTSKLVQRRRDQNGAVAIEFALMAPLVIILVFAVVQFGLVLNAWQGLHAAAREGARVGSLSTSEIGEITTTVSSIVDDLSLSSVSPPAITPCTGPGTTVTVTVAGTRAINIPFYGPPPTIPLSATGQFRCE